MIEQVAAALANPAGATGPRSLAYVKMLRISVTDVCNLRCIYCMPEAGLEWLDRREILTFEEITTVVRAATQAGIGHFKITGGEPTARRDLPLLIEALAGIDGVRDLSLTTNGILLAPLISRLKTAGLGRITISLDSLRPDRFKTITRGGEFHRVWCAIERAIEAGFQRVKLNVVVMGGINEDEVPDFADLTRQLPITVRFIEFMPLGRSDLAQRTDEGFSSLVSETRIREVIEARHGRLLPVRRDEEMGVGPANVWKLSGATRGRIGFISAMSHPFCDTCNRVRLTPEGLLRSCLFDGGEVDLKPLLRGAVRDSVATDGEGQALSARLLDAFGACVAKKPDTHSARGNRAMNRIGG